MCVVSIAWDAHPRWQLVLAGNRDEFHARPSAALARWDGYPHLIAGRDLQSGGTWLGVSEQGRLAVVTNLRGFGDPRPDRTSRGKLLADWLAGEGKYATLNSAQFSDFNPFNLFVAQPGAAEFITNRPNAQRVALGAGIHSLSNTVQDQRWPRRDALEKALQDWIHGAAQRPEELLDVLAEEAWPEAAPQQVGDAEEEPAPIFIRSAVYGTRCSTVIAIERGGLSRIVERRFGEEGLDSSDKQLLFRWG